MPPISLIYQGALPHMNIRTPDWRRRYRLKLTCIRQFGVMPYPPQMKACITLTRVLGPRERQMDTDNFIYAGKAIIDALLPRKPKRHGRGYTGGANYIWDDSPQWLTVTYVQDATQREVGPMVTVEISYKKETPHDADA